jgi:hypothetical protein
MISNFLSFPVAPKNWTAGPPTEDSGDQVITRPAELVNKQGGVVDSEESCDIGTPDRANEEPNNNYEMAAACVQ